MVDLILQQRIDSRKQAVPEQLRKLREGLTAVQIEQPEILTAIKFDPSAWSAVSESFNPNAALHEMQAATNSLMDLVAPLREGLRSALEVKSGKHHLSHKGNPAARVCGTLDRLSKSLRGLNEDLRLLTTATETPTLTSPVAPTPKPKNEAKIFMIGRVLGEQQDNTLALLRFVAIHQFFNGMTPYEFPGLDPFKFFEKILRLGSQTLMEVADNPGAIVKTPADGDIIVIGSDQSVSVSAYARDFAATRKGLVVECGLGLPPDAYPSGFHTHREKQAKNLQCLMILARLTPRELLEYTDDENYGSAVLLPDDTERLQSLIDSSGEFKTGVVGYMNALYKRCAAEHDQHAWGLMLPNLEARKDSIPVMFSIDCRHKAARTILPPVVGTKFGDLSDFGVMENWYMSYDPYCISRTHPMSEAIGKFLSLVTAQRHREDSKFATSLVDFGARYAQLEAKWASEVPVLKVFRHLTILHMPTEPALHEHLSTGDYIPEKVVSLNPWVLDRQLGPELSGYRRVVPQGARGDEDDRGFWEREGRIDMQATFEGLSAFRKCYRQVARLAGHERAYLLRARLYRDRVGPPSDAEIMKVIGPAWEYIREEWGKYEVLHSQRLSNLPQEDTGAQALITEIIREGIASGRDIARAKTLCARAK